MSKEAGLPEYILSFSYSPLLSAKKETATAREQTFAGRRRSCFPAL
jgi:hypothetical protein